jgi:hypothetical protein
MHASPFLVNEMTTETDAIVIGSGITKASKNDFSQQGRKGHKERFFDSGLGGLCGLAAKIFVFSPCPLCP